MPSYIYCLDQDKLFDSLIEPMVPLGHGGNSVVYSVSDKSKNRYAMKRLRFSTESLLHECYNSNLEMMIIRNDYMIPIMAMRAYKDDKYVIDILMPAAECDMSSMLHSRCGNYEEKIALISECALHIISSLHHIHQHGMCHNDIKMANILLSPLQTAESSGLNLSQRNDSSQSLVSGTTKKKITITRKKKRYTFQLSDYDCAHRSGSMSTIKVGSVGTVDHWPNEICDYPTEGSYTTMSDIWSFGIALLQMLVMVTEVRWSHLSEKWTFCSSRPGSGIDLGRIHLDSVLTCVLDSIISCLDKQHRAKTPRGHSQQMDRMFYLLVSLMVTCLRVSPCLRPTSAWLHHHVAPLLKYKP